VQYNTFDPDEGVDEDDGGDLWAEEKVKPVAPEMPFCSVHKVRTCKKGICKEISRLVKEQEKAKKEQEKTKKEKANNAKGKGGNGGQGECYL